MLWWKILETGQTVLLPHPQKGELSIFIIIPESVEMEKKLVQHVRRLLYGNLGG